MEGKHHHHDICPMERAKKMEGRLRSLLHNPKRLLGEYVREGMTVLDLGCGPGFFSRGMAGMVGGTGKVIAADLQDGMLDILKERIKGTDIEKRITIHRTGKDSIGVKGSVDFILAFYVFHELPDQKKALSEMKAILKPGGILYMAEPTHHVGKQEFKESLGKIEHAGFILVGRPRVLLSRAAVFRR
jgi:ubiquinone/menaquinone biosynthesis C-methylase UbiE